MSDSLRPHGLQHTRLPCPSPSPRVCSNSCPLSSVMPSSHLILCHPFSSCPQSFSASGSFPMSQFFTSGGQSIEALSISPSNEYSGLISYRIDWFDLLAVRETLKSLLQPHSLKVSVLWCSAFFMVQLSHLYMTTGKTTALTIWTFVNKNLFSICTVQSIKKQRYHFAKVCMVKAMVFPVVSYGWDSWTIKKAEH